MKFRKKPVVIDAVLWDGNSKTIFPLAPFENASEPPEVGEDGRLHITTLEGRMVADIGDYIIKGVKGEIYPCKPDIFKATYNDAGDDSTAQAILAAGKTASRVTPAELQDNIVSKHYFTAKEGAKASNDPDGIQWLNNYPESLDLLTFCVLVLRNGFTVTGESACASPENFDSAIGRKIARENAIQKLWPLMGYALKERLYQEAQPSTAA